MNSHELQRREVLQHMMASGNLPSHNSCPQLAHPLLHQLQFYDSDKFYQSNATVAPLKRPQEVSHRSAQHRMLSEPHRNRIAYLASLLPGDNLSQMPGFAGQQWPMIGNSVSSSKINENICAPSLSKFSSGSTVDQDRNLHSSSSDFKLDNSSCTYNSGQENVDDEMDFDAILEEAALLVSKSHVPCEKEVFVGGMPRQRSSSSRLSNNVFENRANFVWHKDLFQYFKKYGVVSLIDINVDTSSGLPRGFAFVEFEDSWSALMCRMGLASERIIKDNLCTVDWSRGTSTEKEEKPIGQLDFQFQHSFSSCPNLRRHALTTRVSSPRKRAGHLGAGRGFCTAGTRGSSAHSIETFPSLPQVLENKTKRERMKIQLKGWSWSLHDTIAASGPGGLKFQGAYTEFIMEQTEKYAVFDGTNVCTIPNLCKLDEDEISSMAGVALECAIPLSNKFHGEDKEIFVSSGMPSDAATHVEDWTADSQMSSLEKNEASDSNLFVTRNKRATNDASCTCTAPVSTTTSCSASPNSTN